MKKDTHIVSIGTARIRAQTLTHGAAQPDKPYLLFLHEGLGCIEFWRDFPAKLCRATGLNALLYDRVGHGGSSALDGPRPLDYLHREALHILPALIARMQLDRPVLIGHSDGGTIALIYGAYFPDGPGSIITEAAHVYVEPITVAGIRQAVDQYRSGRLKAALIKYHAAQTDALFRAWADIWLSPSFFNWNIEHLLPLIQTPVLAMQGRQDQYATREHVHRIAAGIGPRAQVREIEHADHTPHHTAAETVLAHMREFIVSWYSHPT